MPYYVYILASQPHGTLYVGVTNDVVRRVYEHKQDVVPGFTRKYDVHRLVHVECFDDVHAAIQREKNVKHWVRQWKVELIEKENPEWRDLFDEIAV